MKLIPMAAAVLAAALTLAATASAQVTSIPLPAPPATGGPAASTIFDAMLAIARAAAANPAAAQRATFSYNAAIQQYNAKDFTRSRLSALQAISETGAAPLPQPSIVAPAIPQPVYVRMPSVRSPDQADAEGFVALARRATALCAPDGAAAPAAVQQQYVAATNALVAHKYDAAKAASQAVIDQCAAVLQAAAAQAAAKPLPPPTPIPFGSYAPVPLATLGPDPALQQAPATMASPTPTPTAEPKRGFRL
jgi:hypothetical protein